MRNSAIDRLYQLLPGYITARDADEGRPLLALMQILTRELELVERDTDQLYDNWFIETCENWAVSYIGDLVGARALREFGEGSLRAYVANTLAYRQAKGTRVILEQLARDVSGWPAVAVEFFSLLQQTRNVNRQKGGVPATMSISSDGGSCMISPGVISCRAVSERETIRCPSQGDRRCPA